MLRHKTRQQSCGEKNAKNQFLGTLAVGIFNEITGQEIGFFDWMKTSVVIAVPLLITAYFLLTRFIKVDVDTVDSAREVLEKKSKELGRSSFKEKMVGLIMLGSIFLWMTESGTLGLANIAIGAVVVLFIFKLVNWKDIEEYVNWGIILMYGGAIALGRAVDSSGALDWLAQKVFIVPTWLALNVGGSATLWLVAVLSLAVILLTEVVSNAAVVALLMPIAITLTKSFGMDPSLAVYMVALPSGLAFLLPMATPAVAIAYSSGYIKVREILWPAILMMFLGWIFFILVAKFLWPVLGLNL